MVRARPRSSPPRTHHLSEARRPPRRASRRGSPPEWAAEGCVSRAGDMESTASSGFLPNGGAGHRSRSRAGTQARAGAGRRGLRASAARRLPGFAAFAPRRSGRARPRGGARRVRRFAPRSIQCLLGQATIGAAGRPSGALLVAPRFNRRCHDRRDLYDEMLYVYTGQPSRGRRPLVGARSPPQAAATAPHRQ